MNGNACWKISRVKLFSLTFATGLPLRDKLLNLGSRFKIAKIRITIATAAPMKAAKVD